LINHARDSLALMHSRLVAGGSKRREYHSWVKLVSTYYTSSKTYAMPIQAQSRKPFSPKLWAHALDSSATQIVFECDRRKAHSSRVDNGCGMQRRELARYHDIAASTKSVARELDLPESE
jgi:hypothetical protein